MELFLMSLISVAGATTVLVEADGFDNPGGWVLDQQAMDQMGSPYLLAHGLGVPVADATTAVTFPAAGEYGVWVRTRDWVAPWGAKGAPGRFQVVVAGKPLEATFGTEGADWHWQDGGTVNIDDTSVEIALHDLTGFEGRCDAIVFSSDPSFVPPNGRDDLAALRRDLLGLPAVPKNAGEFDLVVVGGGMAGTCAAVSAARLDLKVALVQNRPVLGGNNSSEVRVHLGGKTNLPPYPNLGNVVRELDSGLRGNAQAPEHYADDKKLDLVGAEENIVLFLNTHVFKVEKEGARIAAVVGKDIRTGEERRFTAPLFADCTGDGTVGFLAGADYRMGREGRAETGEALAPEVPDKMTMGASVQWYSVDAGEPAPFPDCPWALSFNEDNCQRVTMGEWDWETGMDRDQVTEIEFIRDHAFRVIYGNWSFLKNHCADKATYANRNLDWVAYVAGKRESRRLLGDVILQQQDIEENRAFPDACVTTTWTIDLHYPEPRNAEQFPGQEFRSIAKHGRIKPYPIPYRCLYSRNVDNLFMAGRDISVTHVALGTIRVMRTGGMMGEVVGMAAKVCNEHDVTPRGVYSDHLDALKTLMTEGTGKPPELPGLDPPDWLVSAGPNLAQNAKVEVSGNHDIAKYPPSMLADGEINIETNTTRWVSNGVLPDTVEFTWDAPQTISAARIVTGYRITRIDIQDPIQDFQFQYHDGTGWKAIEETRTVRNTKVDWHTRFAPITTDRLRLLITATPGKLARIWEIELYDPQEVTFNIDADFPGGNIKVERIEGDTVHVRQELRDTKGWWFYWGFRVREAAGRTLTFQFEGRSPIGVRGPAVSSDDGATWSWLGTEAVDDNAFSYTFADGAKDVRFCFAIPYQASELKRFLDAHSGNPHLVVEPHCSTRHGREVERIRAGCLDGEPEHRVLFTARHHACESIADYVLEGILEAVLADTDDGRWFRANVEVLAVPFMDKDGVEDGDQGKNRQPHDHNRDYGDDSIYAAPRALRDFVSEWSQGRLKVALDLHCPYIRGGDDGVGSNERVFFVCGPDDAGTARLQEFAVILERVQTGPLHYAARHNMPWGTGWNKGISGMSAHWMASLSGVLIANTIEIPYANVGETDVTVENARLLGHDLARAIRVYLEAL
jgi:FAD dependent oxidoreductase